MIAYIFFKSNFQINNKIDKVAYIEDKEIRGEDNIAKFGDSSDYIILENDTINLNIEDIIDLTNLVDDRDYFLKGKDYWYQEQIKKHEELINNQQKTIQEFNSNNINTMMAITELYEMTLSN